MLLLTGLLPGIVFVESEFLVPGQYATCGPNALAMAESYGTQVYVGTPTIYNRMRAGTWYDLAKKAWVKRADPDGSSKMGGLEAQADADKFKTVRKNGAADWKAWVIARLKEGAVVIYEPSYGQALHDEISGMGMNAKDLHYHYDLFVGYWPGGYNDKAGKKLDEGFWFSDGDNGAVDSNPGPNAPIINGRHRMVNGRRVQFYSVATIIASAPYAFMAVYPKVSIGDNGGTGMSTAPAGLGGGFADLYVKMGMTATVTVAEYYYNDHESVACLSDGTVFHYDNRTNTSVADTSRGRYDPSIITGLVVALQAAKSKPTAAAPDPTIAAKAAKYDAIKQALA